MLRSRATLCALMAVVTTASGCGLTNGFTRNTVGQRQFKRGNFAEASRQFQMAVADQPHNVDYLHNLGSAKWKQGRVAEAEKAFRRGIHIDPTHQPTYHSLAKMLKETGRVHEAQGLLAMWSETQPYVPESHIEMAWLNRETGNHAGAEQNLRNALKADPKNSTALAHLGQVYQDQGRSGEAVALYRRSLYQDWYQPGVKSRIAGISGPGWHQHSAASPAPVQQPVIVHNPTTQPIVTLMPPVPAQQTATMTLQPVQLGTPVTNADPAHPEARLSAVPAVEAQ